jgi:hypothetical protein
MWRIVSVVLVLAMFAQRGSTPAQDEAGPARVLFIGNSLTYANDLPGLVASLGRSAGRPAETRVVAFPDFSLEDHWQHGEARRALRERRWSHVVLQQGPSALPESQALLRNYVKRFDAEIRRAGARTAVYMVWPSRARERDFDGVSRSYANAAADVKGLLLPVGDAWRAAWARDPSLALYGPDGFHPSPAGSYLAALVIARLVLDVPVAGLPALPATGLPAPTVLLLQQAALDVTTRGAK